MNLKSYPQALLRLTMLFKEFQCLRSATPIVAYCEVLDRMWVIYYH